MNAYQNYDFRQDCDQAAVPLPNELAAMFLPLACNLCDVTVESELTAITHYEGKMHLKNVIAYMKDHYNVVGSLIKQKERFRKVKCEICNTTLTSNVVYTQHINGKPHKKKVLRNSYITESLFDNPLELNDDFSVSAILKSLPPPPKPPKLCDFICEICGIGTNTEGQLELHKNGWKHKRKIERIQEEEMNKEMELFYDTSCVQNEPIVYNAELTTTTDCDTLAVNDLNNEQMNLPLEFSQNVSTTSIEMKATDDLPSNPSINQGTLSAPLELGDCLTPLPTVSNENDQLKTNLNLRDLEVSTCDKSDTLDLENPPDAGDQLFPPLITASNESGQLKTSPIQSLIPEDLDKSTCDNSCNLELKNNSISQTNTEMSQSGVINDADNEGDRHDSSQDEGCSVNNNNENEINCTTLGSKIFWKFKSSQYYIKAGRPPTLKEELEVLRRTKKFAKKTKPENVDNKNQQIGPSNQIESTIPAENKPSQDIKANQPEQLDENKPSEKIKANQPEKLDENKPSVEIKTNQPEKVDENSSSVKINDNRPEKENDRKQHAKVDKDSKKQKTKTRDKVNEKETGKTAAKTIKETENKINNSIKSSIKENNLIESKNGKDREKDNDNWLNRYNDYSRRGTLQNSGQHLYTSKPKLHFNGRNCFGFDRSSRRNYHYETRKRSRSINRKHSRRRSETSKSRRTKDPKRDSRESPSPKRSRSRNKRRKRSTSSSYSRLKRKRSRSKSSTSDSRFERSRKKHSRTEPKIEGKKDKKDNDTVKVETNIRLNQKNNVLDYISPNGTYQCKLCDQTFISTGKFINHLDSEKHKLMIKRN